MDGDDESRDAFIRTLRQCKDLVEQLTAARSSSTGAEPQEDLDDFELGEVGTQVLGLLSQGLYREADELARQRLDPNLLEYLDDVTAFIHGLPDDEGDVIERVCEAVADGRLFGSRGGQAAAVAGVVDDHDDEHVVPASAAAIVGLTSVATVHNTLYQRLNDSSLLFRHYGVPVATNAFHPLLL
jgi:hypothetical protein